MGARVNNAIHVQVQIIKLHVIWIRFTAVHWNFDSIDFLSLHKIEYRKVINTQMQSYGNYFLSVIS